MQNAAAAALLIKCLELTDRDLTWAFLDDARSALFGGTAAISTAIGWRRVTT